MEEVEAALMFPVVLHNGEKQKELGNLAIHPTLDFNQFRMILSEKVGIWYRNLTTYLVVHSKEEYQTKSHRKLITGEMSSNYFLVMCKKIGVPPVSTVVIPCTEIWFNEFQKQRASYMNRKTLNWNKRFRSTVMNESFPYPTLESCWSRTLCEDCTIAEGQGKKPSFHLCVYDNVLPGFFRSPVGPIFRPRSKLLI